MKHLNKRDHNTSIDTQDFAAKTFLDGLHVYKLHVYMYIYMHVYIYMPMYMHVYICMSHVGRTFVSIPFVRLSLQLHRGGCYERKTYMYLYIKATYIYKSYICLVYKTYIHLVCKSYIYLVYKSDIYLVYIYISYIYLVMKERKSYVVDIAIHKGYIYLVEKLYLYIYIYI